jgi:hypothetical protein
MLLRRCRLSSTTSNEQNDIVSGNKWHIVSCGGSYEYSITVMRYSTQSVSRRKDFCALEEKRLCARPVQEGNGGLQVLECNWATFRGRGKQHAEVEVG